jgi:general secretion pathway protein B
MSYILDALKKSDQLRQRGSTPTLLTAQSTPTEPSRPRYVMNGVLAVVLISAGIALGWLRPWQTEQPAPATEPPASLPVVPGTNLAFPTPLDGSPEATAEQQPHSPAAGAATKQDIQALAGLESLPPSPQAEPTARNATAGQLPGGGSDEAGRKIMALNDLPPSIRREIPMITISFHAYSSDPVERRVMINDKMARQGEPLADGLSLEQITADGVVLDYKGFRFHHGVR